MRLGLLARDRSVTIGIERRHVFLVLVAASGLGGGGKQGKAGKGNQRAHGAYSDSSWEYGSTPEAYPG